MRPNGFFLRARSVFAFVFVETPGIWINQTVSRSFRKLSGERWTTYNNTRFLFLVLKTFRKNIVYYCSFYQKEINIWDAMWFGRVTWAKFSSKLRSGLFSIMWRDASNPIVILKKKRWTHIIETRSTENFKFCAHYSFTIRYKFVFYNLKLNCRNKRIYCWFQLAADYDQRQ